MIPYSELEELERVRSRTLDLVAGLSQEELDHRPSTSGWSAGEVLDHLLKAEESNRREIANLVGLARSGRTPSLRRDLTPDSLAPACVPRSLLPLFSLPATFATQLIPVSLRELLIRNRLFPARAAQELQPRYGRPGGELRADLASSVAEMRALLVANPDLDYRRMIFQHPFLGTNDVHDILRLTAAHEGRHQDQIQGLLRARPDDRHRAPASGCFSGCARPRPAPAPPGRGAHTYRGADRGHCDVRGGPEERASSSGTPRRSQRPRGSCSAAGCSPSTRTSNPAPLPSLSSTPSRRAGSRSASSRRSGNLSI